jgi:hypothetical protein
MSVSSISALIRRPFAVRPGEKLLKVNATDDTVTVMISWIRVAETNREWRIVAAGRSLLTWARPESTNEAWVWLGRLDVEDEGFKPVVHLKYGEPNTPDRVLERRNFARDCYRPGTERSPMDNWLRTVDGHTPESMTRHWDKS